MNSSIKSVPFIQVLGHELERKSISRPAKKHENPNLQGSVAGGQAGVCESLLANQTKSTDLG